jgi:hypothetical protein
MKYKHFLYPIYCYATHDLLSWSNFDDFFKEGDWHVYISTIRAPNLLKLFVLVLRIKSIITYRLIICHGHFEEPTYTICILCLFLTYNHAFHRILSYAYLRLFRLDVCTNLSIIILICQRIAKFAGPAWGAVGGLGGGGRVFCMKNIFILNKVWTQDKIYILVGTLLV